MGRKTNRYNRLQDKYDPGETTYNTDHYSKSREKLDRFFEEGTKHGCGEDGNKMLKREDERDDERKAKEERTKEEERKKSRRPK